MQVRELNDKYSTTNVRWGIIRDKNLSEQLDSATVVLTNVSSMNIEPYDLIQLTNESGNVESWLIANVNKDYVTYNAPFKFDYTLELMSLVKWLENIPIPSMSITNIGQNRSIKSYIQRVIEGYVLPEISKYVSTATYTGLDSRFDAVCPEMDFSQTTVREYLDWMVGNFGCIITVNYTGGRNIDVGVLDLNAPAGTVPTQYIDDIKEMQSGAEYVTQFEHNIQEVIAQEPITEYVTLKGNGYVFNSDNTMISLSHKPYDLVKVVVKTSLRLYTERTWKDAPGAQTQSDTYTIRLTNIDITKFIVQKNIYDTLKIPEGQLTYDRYVVCTDYNATKEDLNIGEANKINSMSWSRGDKKILGTTDVTQYKVLFADGNTAPVICYAIIESWLNDNWTNPMGPTYEYSNSRHHILDFDWSDLLLEVTYIPYISPRLLVEQKDSFSHLVTMQDNSTNTRTELGKFLSYSLEKNSKLGNTSKIITGMSKVENGDYTPKFAVGQIWRDETNSKYVLSSLEYSTFKNSILYKGTLTKNYTNRILNTLINREKRYYSLPDPSEVVDRKEVTKDWVKIQLHSSFSGTTITTSDLFEKPLFALFTATFKDNSSVMGTLYADSVYGGNLISHNVAFEDNISFASSVSELTVGGYKMNIEKYVDDDGELESLQFRFGKASGINQDNLFKSLSVGKLGLTGYQLLWQSYTINLLKDSRERISWSLERIFYSDNSNIKLGNNFAELFKDKTKNLSITYTYSYSGMIQSDTFNVTANDFLTSQAWSIFLRQGTSGTLTVKESNDPNANVYLTINNFDAGDYLVFTTGSKRG